MKLTENPPANPTGKLDEIESQFSLRAKIRGAIEKAVTVDGMHPDRAAAIVLWAAVS